MTLQKGLFYFLDDYFFLLCDDPFLKKEHEDTKRPHYLAVQDNKTGLYWLVPSSSRIEKYERIIHKRVLEGKKNYGIKIVTVQGMKEALLFQDMFPVCSELIEKPYIRGGQPYCIANPKTVAELEHNASAVISMIRKGIRFTPTQPNALQIETVMLHFEESRK